MELLQLKYFCDAAQTQNFSKTAEKYRVPPSNISQIIRRLENELGVKLFAREANRLVLNEQGKLFYRKIKSALSLIEEAKEDMSADNDTFQGTIKLLIRSNRWLVSSCISKFKEKYPLAHFRIHHSTLKEYGDYDFVISDIKPHQTYDQKILLIKQPLMIAMHKNHPLASKPDLTLADLSQEEFIAAKDDASLYRALIQLCAQQGFVPNITIQSEDPNYIRAYLNMGLGVSLLCPSTHPKKYPESIILKSIGEYYRETYVFCERKSYLSPVKQCFLEDLIQTFEKKASPVASLETKTNES